MSRMRQGWLVARREMRERSRSSAFRTSVVIMILAVAALIVLPTLLTGSTTRDVGLTGATPAQLAQTLEARGDAAGTPVRVHSYDTLTAGEQAVRDGDIDALVVDGRRLEWPRRVDDNLKSDVAAAIQLVAIGDRAAATGLSPGQLATLLSPVAITDVRLGMTAGSGPGDEVAVLAMTGVLLFSIVTFGSLVLSGVVEEKANRVVEVLLTRVPPGTLLTGKITGIGLLGLAQIAVTGAAALIAVAVVGTDLPAVRPSVVAWALVWFILGYALYATAYGVLGSLATRVEDAQSTAGPVSVVLMIGYFASFAALGSPDTTWATLVSIFPPTAPLAMPGRIALGVTAWWEPVLAVVLTLATIAALVRLGGRVYLGALLHTGEPLSLRAAWRRSTQPARPRGGHPTSPLAAGVASVPAPGPSATVRRHPAVPKADLGAHRLLLTVLVLVGAVAGVTVALVTHDVIIGVIVGSALIAVSTQLGKLWTGHGGGTLHRP